MIQLYKPNNLDFECLALRFTLPVRAAQQQLHLCLRHAPAWTLIHTPYMRHMLMKLRARITPCQHCMYARTRAVVHARTQVRSLAFSPDGARLAAAGDDEGVRIYAVDKQQASEACTCHGMMARS